MQEHGRPVYIAHRADDIDSTTSTAAFPWWGGPLVKRIVYAAMLILLWMFWRHGRAGSPAAAPESRRFILVLNCSLASRGLELICLSILSGSFPMFVNRPRTSAILSAPLGASAAFAARFSGAPSSAMEIWSVAACLPSACRGLVCPAGFFPRRLRRAGRRRPMVSIAILPPLAEPESNRRTNAPQPVPSVSLPLARTDVLSPTHTPPVFPRARHHQAAASPDLLSLTGNSRCAHYAQDEPVPGKVA